jgi:hypothetical protein
VRLQTEVAAVAAAAAARPVALESGGPSETSRFAMRRDGAGPRIERAVELQPAATAAAATGEVAGAETTEETVGSGEAVPWPDESAEAAFLGEAKDRGEVVVARKADDDGAEETTAKALPPLDAMVARIPAPVLETLEDLFRAKFVAVKKVPKKALKR